LELIETNAELKEESKVFEKTFEKDEILDL